MHHGSQEQPFSEIAVCRPQTRYIQYFDGSFVNAFWREICIFFFSETLPVSNK